MFEHADGYDFIKLVCITVQIQVVFQNDFCFAIQSFFMNPFFSCFVLIFRQGNAVGMNAVFLGSIDNEFSPAAADIQKGFSRLQKQLSEGQVDFIHLGFIQAVVFMFEISAGIGFSGIQEGIEKIISQIIVGVDV